MTPWFSVRVTDEHAGTADCPVRDAAAAEGPEPADRARDDPRVGTRLAGRDLAAGRNLEADRLARDPIAARGRARAGSRRGAGRSALRRSVLRARARRGARARLRPGRAVPARGRLRSAR